MKVTDIIGLPSVRGFLPTPRLISLMRGVDVRLQPRAEFAGIDGKPTNVLFGVWRQKTGTVLPNTRIVEDDGLATHEMVAAYDAAVG